MCVCKSHTVNTYSIKCGFTSILSKDRPSSVFSLSFNYLFLNQLGPSRPRNNHLLVEVEIGGKTGTYHHIKLLSPFLWGVRWCLVLACVADKISYFVEIRVLFVIQYGAAAVQFRLWGRHCSSYRKKIHSSHHVFELDATKLFLRMKVCRKRHVLFVSLSVWHLYLSLHYITEENMNRALEGWGFDPWLYPWASYWTPSRTLYRKRKCLYERIWILHSICRFLRP